MHLFVALAAVFILIWSVKKLSQIGVRPSQYPPGPRTLPLLGNLHQMPWKDIHVQFQRWAKEYGSIYSIIAGTRTVVFLNSPEAIKALLDRKGAIYSSRPDSHIMHLISGGNNFGLMPYDKTWQQCRAIFTKALAPQWLSSTIAPYQDLESKQMLYDLCHNPKDFKDHLSRYTNSVAYQLAFGFRVTDCHDENLKQVFAHFERWNQLLPQVNVMLLDLYPILRSLPDFLVPVRKFARKSQVEECSFYRGHYRTIKEKIRNGTAQPCLAMSVLKAQKEHSWSEDLASMVCGVLLEAGSDTTAKQLHSFILAMVLFPEAQRRAQQEIDNVCGDRLPDLDDASRMPYVRACVKETLRWLPTAILGVPHALIQDDVYNGYKIPKGAFVIPNVWAINRDPKRHPEPSRFKPERYLGDDTTARQSAVSENPKDRDHFTFGAGRRICPGMDVADTSMFLAFARMLWAFDITKARDAAGNEITPDQDAIKPGMAAGPMDFLANITPRSEKRREMLETEWAEARTMLNEDDMQWKEVPEGSRLPSPDSV